MVAPSLNRLLVPLDGSPRMGCVLDLVQAISPDNARVVLVCVVAPVEHATSLVGASAQSLDMVGTQRAAAEAEAYLGLLRERLQRSRFAV